MGPNPFGGGVRVTVQNLWQMPVQLPARVDHGSRGGSDIHILSVLYGPLPGQDVDQGDTARQGLRRETARWHWRFGCCRIRALKVGGLNM